MRIPVRGCRDVAPAAAAGRRALVTRFGALAARYGFAEVETPLLERARLYAASLGATSDVVSAELFRVTGPAGAPAAGRDALALRPEGTAGVARAFGAHAARVAPGEAARVWYAGPMFRYERPQRLRLRQFHQLGVECLGEESVAADLDCISLAHTFMAATPVGRGSTLCVNTLGSRDDRAAFNERLRAWLVPRRERLSAMSRDRFDAGNCMRILDSKLPEDADTMCGAPSLAEAVSRGELDRFATLKEMLTEEGVPFTVDPKLVRGLDYYTSTAFEFINSDGRAVCAGGRYNGLEGVSGVGFAAGLERLEDTDTEDAPDGALGGVANGVAVFAIAGPTPESSRVAETNARSCVRQLRDAGACAMLWSVRSSKVGKAIGRVVRDGALAVVVVGPDDVAQGVAQIKLIDSATTDMRTDQRAVDLTDVATVVQSHLNGFVS